MKIDDFILKIVHSEQKTAIAEHLFVKKDETF